MALGTLLLALSGGLLAFTVWSEWQHRPDTTVAPRNDLVPTQTALQAAAPTRLPTAPPRPTPPAEPTLGPTAVPTLAPTVTPAATATAEPQPLAETPEEPISYGPATWMEIPSINIDSRIMEVGVKGGEYEAPAWDIGHHEDSANPGELGNSVFNGHLTTINAGHVFARLRDVKIGDTILVYTHTHLLEWRVNETFDVDNDDNAFIQPTDDTRITLYTCDGTLLPLAHDYTNRLVVIGRLAGVQPRGDQ